ncbi:TPA: DUF1372 family protein [Streptococcus pneumoniae]
MTSRTPITKEQYESINVGDDAPGYLKK